MTNFNPMNFLNNFNSQFLNNAKSLNNAQAGGTVGAQNTNNIVQNLLNTSVLNQSQNLKSETKSNLNPNLKMSEMEVQETSRYVKELLNLPKDVMSVISQMTSKSTMTTAQNVKLLMLMSNGQIDLQSLANLLSDNSKSAIQKLVQTMSEATRQGIKDVSQLRDLINTLGSISTTSADTTSALKNFILLYLPWLPINEQGENRDFDIEVFEKNEEAEGSNGQNITILIQTVNFGNIKVILEEQKSSQVEIMMTCADSFPRDKVLAILKKESQDLNIKAGLSVEISKKEISMDEVKKLRAQISSSPSVSPQLMLMAHSVIKIVIKIDKDFS